MTTRRQFALIFLSTVALASLASHAIMQLLAIQPYIPYPEIDLGFHSIPMVAAGSSLITYGIDWNLVGKAYSRNVKILTTPAASPCELEMFQLKEPATDFTIIGVAESDMDEYSLSDFRADCVPAMRTWRDLRDSHADKTLVQRTMSKYPLRYARVLFPIAGRSGGVQVRLRDFVRDFMRRRAASETDPLPTFNVKSGYPTNRISDWDTGRVLRNTEQQRQLCGGCHSFSGPKHLALERMLRWAAARGKAVVVVMPVPPLYQQKVIDSSVTQSFEASLTDMARRVPAAKWIRLDRIPEFHSNDMYWDLVHLNAYARPLATAALLKQLEPIMRAP